MKWFNRSKIQEEPLPWFQKYWSFRYLSPDEKILLSLFDGEVEFTKQFPEWFIIGSTTKSLTLKSCIFSFKTYISTGEWKYYKDFEVWQKDSYND